MNNPYTLAFGMEPAQMISRVVQTSQVLDDFTSDIPSQYVYMITGVRGSGKTVFLSDISSHLKKQKNWITVELNPQKDMLIQLAAKLSSEDSLARIFRNAKINLSFFGFGLQLNDVAPITDIETALSKMISSLNAHGKRILICVDEASNNPYVREFSAAYQILLRDKLPVFLLMTGLYENINDLRNEKNLTFLYRAPRIEMGPLNLGAVARNYRSKLRLDEEKSLTMAKITGGYSYAFQLLGYFTWENDGDYTKAMDTFRQYLDEYVYDKIWSELSPKDKEYLYAIASTDSSRVMDIRETLGVDSNSWNPYRDRLVKKGLIDKNRRGHAVLLLPLFDEYVREHHFMSA